MSSRGAAFEGDRHARSSGDAGEGCDVGGAVAVVASMVAAAADACGGEAACAYVVADSDCGDAEDAGGFVGGEEGLCVDGWCALTPAPLPQAGEGIGVGGYGEGRVSCAVVLARPFDRLRVNGAEGGSGALAEATEFTGIISLSIPLGNYRRGRTTFDSKQHQFTTSLDQYAADGSWHALIEGRNGNGTPKADARFEFTANKLRGNLRHDRVFNDDIEGGVSVANFSSAIAFADGYVGISRPIADSFAIVVPHNSMADSFIGVNPTLSGWDAASWPGPAVLSDLRSFETAELAIEAPDVAANVDLGEDHPAVYAGYRTGTVVPIGTEPTVVVRGRLLDGDGDPLALKVGRLEAPADTQIFTNHNGIFVATGLVEGAYRLTVSGRRYGFTVEAVEPRILELGDLEPQ